MLRKIIECIKWRLSRKKRYEAYEKELVAKHLAGITPHGRAILERMYRRSGDTRTIEEHVAEYVHHSYFTRKQADKMIKQINRNRSDIVLVADGDDGPVIYTKEDMIRQIESFVVDL